MMIRACADRSVVLLGLCATRGLSPPTRSRRRASRSASRCSRRSNSSARRNIAERSVRLKEADAVPDKSPYETYVIEETRAVAAIDSGDDDGRGKGARGGARDPHPAAARGDKAAAQHRPARVPAQGLPQDRRLRAALLQGRRQRSRAAPPHGAGLLSRKRFRRRRQGDPRRARRRCAAGQAGRRDPAAVARRQRVQAQEPGWLYRRAEAPRREPARSTNIGSISVRAVQQ